MTARFAVVHEAKADFQIATELADRVLVEAVDWLDEDLLSSHREWVGEIEGRRLTWTGIGHLADEARIKVHGHFDGEPGLPDAAAARRAIVYLRRFVAPDGIVLVRDQDHQPERRQGLEQARAQDKSGIPIVIGLAVVVRECWVLCGFEPHGDQEIGRLAEVTNLLGFDPRLRNHELQPQAEDPNRRPKRVLKQLVGGDTEREQRCWLAVPLETLRERGKSNGLVEYLTEIQARLGPLIGTA